MCFYFAFAHYLLHFPNFSTFVTGNLSLPALPLKSEERKPLTERGHGLISGRTSACCSSTPSLQPRGRRFSERLPLLPKQTEKDRHLHVSLCAVAGGGPPTCLSSKQTDLPHHHRQRKDLPIFLLFSASPPSRICTQAGRKARWGNSLLSSTFEHSLSMKKDGSMQQLGGPGRRTDSGREDAYLTFQKGPATIQTDLSSLPSTAGKNRLSATPCTLLSYYHPTSLLSWGQAGERNHTCILSYTSVYIIIFYSLWEAGCLWTSCIVALRTLLSIPCAPCCTASNGSMAFNSNFHISVCLL